MRTFVLKSILNCKISHAHLNFLKTIQINTKVNMVRFAGLSEDDLALLYRFVEVRDCHNISKMNK